MKIYLLFNLNLCIAFGLKVKKYQYFNISNYEILKTLTFPKSDMQCSIECGNTMLCSGIIYKENDCKLLSDVIIDPDGSESAMVDFELYQPLSKYLPKVLFFKV